MRTPLPLLDSRRQAQSKDIGRGAGGGNLHLRYLEHAIIARNRDLAQPGWCVTAYSFPVELVVTVRVAIVALSPAADNSFLAYSSPVPSPTSMAQANAAQTSANSAQTGDVLLFSTRSLTVANVIQAHKSPISFLSINSTGTMLATASDKGTVIRVWSIPGAEKLYQFRRGTREAKIYSINFNLMSTLLAVSSAHDTIHIFKLGPQKSGGASSSGSSIAVGSKSSDSGSIDSREGTHGLDGGYEAYADKKKGSGVS